MNLHQPSVRPDWETVPLSQRNPWQRMAAASSGVLTPGNAVSFSGLALVGLGLLLLHDGKFVSGLLAIIAGRLCDILDGMLADHTGTKSTLGEGVDAGFDKLGAFATLLVLGAQHIVPWPLALAIIVQNAANSILAFVAKMRRLTLHPLAEGKWATAGQWVGLVGFIAMMIAANWVLYAASYAILGGSLALGVYATVRYVLKLKSAVPLDATASRRRSKPHG